jgi:hypothetical protein
VRQKATKSKPARLDKRKQSIGGGSVGLAALRVPEQSRYDRNDHRIHRDAAGTFGCPAGKEDAQ